ncbi:MAG: carbohydrate ABC transporter permease [Eubacteriales bacterium]|nr:carbohydrate ABC transporter permease [Eubacteriales bacterium]
MSRKTKKKLGRVVLYLLVLLIVISVVAPFAWMVISSISTKADLLKRPMRWYPEHPTFDNYKAMLFGTTGKTTDAASQFLSALKNSLIITLTVTFIALAIGLIASYGFSRFRFRGRTLMLNTTLFTQMIPPIAIIIPMYTIMLRLRLLDTKWALIITYLSFVLPYLIWLLKGYIDGIPMEMEEAAMIDGCSKMRAFFSVVLPMASTGLAATVIFAFILSWNEFFYAVNFTSTTAAKTLPVLITEFSSKFGADFIMACTAGVLASLPPVLISLIFQRYIISGLSAGAVKG